MLGAVSKTVAAENTLLGLFKTMRHCKTTGCYIHVLCAQLETNTIDREPEQNALMCSPQCAAVVNGGIFGNVLNPRCEINTFISMHRASK